MGKVIKCECCGLDAPKRGNGLQKYCEPCSAEKHAERQRKWSRENPASLESAARVRHALKSREVITGKATSARQDRGIAWVDDVNLLWVARTSVPFTYAASKNAIYAMRSGGHVALRRGVNNYKLVIIAAIREALAGRRIAHNKVWIDLLVQKPDHKGDAINVVDLVCDAIKLALQVDDRWFSIRRLDWQVIKSGDPRLYIGIGQESHEDACICSSCGRMLPLSAFNKHKTTKLGVGRNCKECRTGTVVTSNAHDMRDRVWLEQDNNKY